MFRRGFRGRRPVIIRPVVIRPGWRRPWLFRRPPLVRPYWRRPWFFNGPLGLGGCGLVLMLPALLCGLLLLAVVIRHI